MKFKEYKEHLKPTEIALLRKDGKEFVVAERNRQGGVCDCCTPDGLGCGGIDDCELIMVKDVTTHDTVFEPE